MIGSHADIVDSFSLCKHWRQPCVHSHPIHYSQEMLHQYMDQFMENTESSINEFPALLYHTLSSSTRSFFPTVCENCIPQHSMIKTFCSSGLEDGCSSLYSVSSG